MGDIRLVEQTEHEKVRAAIFHPGDTYGVMTELIECEANRALISALRK